MISKPRAIVGAALAGVLAVAMTACSSSSGSASGGGGGTTSLLTMEQSPDSPLTQNFNPFSGTSTGNTLGAISLVYENLLQFDILKPGTTYPWLAKTYAWSNGGRTLTFSLQPGVKWSDGQAFSSADVAFTYNLIMQNKALNSNGLTISSVSAPDANTVVLTFPTPQYVNLFYIASTYIVPKHIWSSISNPSTWPDPTPVGTGPYVMDKFTTQGVSFKKNTSYWQPGKPAIQEIEFPAYVSNTTANSALASGSLDWGGNFVPDISKTYTSKSAHNKYWFPPVNTVSLFPNLTKAPLNNVAVRQAISAALDRNQISAEGESGYEPPATSSTGLIFPTDTSYLAPGMSQSDLTQDKAKVATILQGAGYTMQGGKWKSASGQTISFSIEEPSSYTDFMASAQIVAQQLNSQGFDVTVSGVSISTWGNDINNGTFDAAIHWSQAGPSPYYMYDNWLDDTLSAPVGQMASGDYERFNSPQVQNLLKEYADTNDTATQTTAIQGIETIVSQQLPIIPLVYGVDWNEYNDSKITGWPSESDPYQQPSPSAPFNEYTILQLRPAS